MPRTGPNYIWRKRVTPDWLDRNELTLNDATGAAHSIVERPGAQRLELEMFCETFAPAERLKALFGGRTQQLRGDWHSRFLTASQLKPLRIGRRLIVLSDEAAAETDAFAARLVIPAGAAFGTGDHATTAMSLRLLERVSRRWTAGWTMLDAGTGSGILALAGKRFGAGKVLAIDNDPTAVSTARGNARANGVTGVKFVHGDIKNQVSGEFDVITANLYSELLAAVMPRFRRWLLEEGRLILSGVLRRQEPEVKRALESNALGVLEARRRGKWVALLAAHCTKNVVDGEGAQKHLPSHR